MTASGAVINVKDTNGTVKQVTLYTDTADVTDVYKEFKYNGQTVYASTTTDPNDEYATEFRYIDTDGVTRYLCEVNPIPAIPTTNGTLSISGDLDGDLVVNGNVEVSGEISGNVTASGTITAGSVSGSIMQNATLTKCDIQIDNGTLTFSASASVSGGKVTTAARVTNKAETVLYCDVDITASSSYPLDNNSGKLTVDGNVQVVTTASSYALYNRNSGEVIVNGTLTAEGGHYGVYNYGSSSNFTVSAGATVYATGTGSSGCGVYNSGTVTVNGTLTAEGGMYGVSNVGTFTVNGTVTATGNRSDSRGVYNYSGGTIEITATGTFTATTTSTSSTYNGYWQVDGSTTICNGLLYGYSGGSTPVSISGTLSGSGSIYANDVLYWQNGSYV